MARPERTLTWRFVHSRRSGKFYVRVSDGKGQVKDFPIKGARDEEEAKNLGFSVIQSLREQVAKQGYTLEYHRGTVWPWSAKGKVGGSMREDLKGRLAQVQRNIQRLNLVAKRLRRV